MSTTLAVTSKVRKRLPDFPDADSKAVAVKLAEWLCDSFVAKRKHYAIAINAESMFVLLVRMSPVNSLRSRLAVALESALVEFRIDEKECVLEAESLRVSSVINNKNRSLQGSLNDLISRAETEITEVPVRRARDPVAIQSRLPQGLIVVSNTFAPLMP